MEPGRVILFIGDTDKSGVEITVCAQRNLMLTFQKHAM